jgi:hypothetical protein
MSEKQLTQREPAFKLEVSDDQCRAIGHVALQWAFLESEIDREIHWLNETNDEPVKLRSKFEDRARGWRRMATLTYEDHPKFIEAVAGIATKAVAIKPDRDKLIHCNLSSTGVIFRIRRARIIEVSDTGTAQHIDELAYRISEISAELFRHQARVVRVFKATL